MEKSRKAIYANKLKLDNISSKKNKRGAMQKDSLFSFKLNNLNGHSKGNRLKNIKSNSDIPGLKANFRKSIINTSLNEEIKKLESLTEKNLNLKFNWLDLEKRLIEISLFKKLKPIIETSREQLKFNNQL